MFATDDVQNLFGEYCWVVLLIILFNKLLITILSIPNLFAQALLTY